MIFGQPVQILGQIPRVAVISQADIDFAAELLNRLAEQMGKAPSYWQKRKLTKLARGVAMRRKQGLTPLLTQSQAVEMIKILQS